MLKIYTKCTYNITSKKCTTVTLLHTTAISTIVKLDVDMDGLVIHAQLLYDIILGRDNHEW